MRVELLHTERIHELTRLVDRVPSPELELELVFLERERCDFIRELSDEAAELFLEDGDDGE